VFTARCELNLQFSNVCNKSYAITQTISRRPLKSETEFVFQASPYEICGRQNDTDRILLEDCDFFPLLVSFHQCFLLIFVCKLLF
jgi:hypothetical protein